MFIFPHKVKPHHNVGMRPARQRQLFNNVTQQCLRYNRMTGVSPLKVENTICLTVLHPLALRSNVTCLISAGRLGYVNEISGAGTR